MLDLNLTDSQLIEFSDEDFQRLLKIQCFESGVVTGLIDLLYRAIDLSLEEHACLYFAELASFHGFEKLAWGFVDKAEPSKGDEKNRLRWAGVICTLGDYSRALELFSQLDQNEFDADAHAYFGICLMYNKKYQSALKSFNAALRLEPGNQLAILGFCEINFVFSDEEQIRHILEHAAKHGVAPNRVYGMMTVLELSAKKVEVTDFVLQTEPSLEAVNLSRRDYNKRLYQFISELKSDRSRAALATYNLMLFDDPVIKIFEFILQQAVQHYLAKASSATGIIDNRVVPETFRFQAEFIAYEKNKTFGPFIDDDAWLSGFYFIREPTDNMEQALRYACLDFGAGPEHLTHRVGDYPTLSIIPADGCLVFAPAFIWQTYTPTFEFKKGYAIKFKVLS